MEKCELSFYLASLTAQQVRKTATTLTELGDNVQFLVIGTLDKYLHVL